MTNSEAAFANAFVRSCSRPVAWFSVQSSRSRISRRFSRSTWSGGTARSWSAASRVTSRSLLRSRRGSERTGRCIFRRIRLLARVLPGVRLCQGLVWHVSRWISSFLAKRSVITSPPPRVSIDDWVYIIRVWHETLLPLDACVQINVLKFICTISNYLESFRSNASI